MVLSAKQALSRPVAEDSAGLAAGLSAVEKGKR